MTETIPGARRIRANRLRPGDCFSIDGDPRGNWPTVRSRRVIDGVGLRLELEGGDSPAMIQPCDVVWIRVRQARADELAVNDRYVTTDLAGRTQHRDGSGWREALTVDHEDGGWVVVGQKAGGDDLYERYEPDDTVGIAGPGSG